MPEFAMGFLAGTFVTLGGSVAWFLWVTRASEVDDG